MKNGSLSARLGHAWVGIRLVWRREKTFRTHGLFALAALAVTAALRVGPVWWAGAVLLASIGAAIVGALMMLDRLHG